MKRNHFQMKKFHNFWTIFEITGHSVISWKFIKLNSQVVVGQICLADISLHFQKPSFLSWCQNYCQTTNLGLAFFYSRWVSRLLLLIYFCAVYWYQTVLINLIFTFILFQMASLKVFLVIKYLQLISVNITWISRQILCCSGNGILFPKLF